MRPLAILLAAALAVPLAAAQAQDRPDLSGFWTPEFGPAERDQALLDKLPPNTGMVEDTGVAEFPRGEFGELKLKPEARAKAEQWKPEDDMTLQRVCLAPSIIYSVQGPFPFEIHQGRDLIAFKYEYFDQVRLIHMDGRDHPPEDAPHSKMGFSTGRWEGGELVIETTHIAPSTITNNGLDHSGSIRMVERYKLSDDGTKLHATEWFSDPETLENNGARYITWEKRPGQYVYPYECDPTFAVEYQSVVEAAAD